MVPIPAAGSENVSADLDFVTLDSEDDYARYFNQLSLVFKRLLACYAHVGGGDSQEAADVSRFLVQLLHTIELLRFKYTCRHQADRSLWVDLSESGFPNFAEISAIETDLLKREERLLELPGESSLKRSIVDFMFARQAEPAELLADLSERVYLERLVCHDLFLPFSPGEIELCGTNHETRSYTFSWGCYDYATNRPYLHVFSFEQDKDAPALTTNAVARDQFFDLMRAEGSRAPDVGVLAMAIDEAGLVRPKILKRICIGPLYVSGIVRKREPNAADPREVVLCGLFDRYAASPQEFMLFFTEEIVFSKRQEVGRSLLSPLGKVRQIFSIAEDDADAYARRASVVYHNVLTSHRLLRAFTPEDIAAVPDLSKCRRFVFDDRGAVHGL